MIFEPRSVAFERDFAGRQEVVRWTAAFFYFYFTGGRDQKRILARELRASVFWEE